MEAMQTNTIEPAADARPPAAHTVGDSIRRVIGGPRGLVILGLAIVATGLALGWNWLTAAGVAPLILSLAPCAAMCAVGACAMSRGGTTCTKPEKADPTALSTTNR